MFYHWECLPELPAVLFSSSDGALMFQQVPMVEIDGMKLIQTKAILNYIAEKYNLHGKDIKDRAMYGLEYLMKRASIVSRDLCG